MCALRCASNRWRVLLDAPRARCPEAPCLTDRASLACHATPRRVENGDHRALYEGGRPGAAGAERIFAFANSIELALLLGTATFRAPGRRVGSPRPRRQLPERGCLAHARSVAHGAPRSPAAPRLFQQISYVLQSGIGAFEPIRPLALSPQPT